eukprot:CAMPEP_0173381426 /NCGR_PEP_ID=MMETSP1356-20130122/3791_1 /TAXON_ID=77927 ORGANISM="Hemiselmis virescens, Strain PCC157" /NCGR_SAMPLE_ID=MMETSP1356 /ASSEMBLY_ACC=CAM_ASM_000847 /LENGTH=151 /DNA_ID=CAMNT_0014335233 /DNA_START=193 /DNA_END=645 /DNA_ORIENTATION=+
MAECEYCSIFISGTDGGLPDPANCTNDDDYPDWCCNCLKEKIHWKDYDEQACAPCRDRRRAERKAAREAARVLRRAEKARMAAKRRDERRDERRKRLGLTELELLSDSPESEYDSESYSEYDSYDSESSENGQGQPRLEPDSRLSRSGALW